MFQGQMGMVSEWMEGGNLQQYIRNHPNVERYQLVRVGFSDSMRDDTHVFKVRPSGYRRSLSS